MSSTQNKIALASRIMFPGMPAGEIYEVFEINMWTLYCVKNLPNTKIQSSANAIIIVTEPYSQQSPKN